MQKIEGIEMIDYHDFIVLMMFPVVFVFTLAVFLYNMAFLIKQMKKPIHGRTFDFIKSKGSTLLKTSSTKSYSIIKSEGFGLSKDSSS